MTIAACYVSNEGVVLGADSTTSFASEKGVLCYNNAQKIFEIGERGSTLGVVNWGLGALPETSTRQLIAALSDSLIATPPANVSEAMDRWVDIFGQEYFRQCDYFIKRCQHLFGLPNRTELEQDELLRLHQELSVGFCIGGRVAPDRRMSAYVAQFDPLRGPPKADELPRLRPHYWGVPNFLHRLLDGIDDQFYNAIGSSPHWTGGPQELANLAAQFRFRVQIDWPLREVINWIYSSIFTTIKGLKFTNNPQLCGGPIEIAAITADRPFRWVCHKELDAAIGRPSIARRRTP